MENTRRSPLWSSWSISLLIPDTFYTEYHHKSSVEQLVYILSDSLHSYSRGNSGAHGPFPCWCHAHLIKNMNRSPLWISWSISQLSPYVSNNECEQKFHVEHMVHFLTDSIHSKQFQARIWAEGICGALCSCAYWLQTLLIRSISRGPLWISCSISLMVPYSSTRK